MTSEDSSSSRVPRTYDDRWIQIQKNTFTNWINEQLKNDSDKLIINDLQLDLTNGIVLIKLINLLQQPNSKIPKKYFKKPLNQHQCLENINIALNAIISDGIKLVNIGNTDIHDANLKLILGLVWHLILRYQIGKTKIPPKKLILAWLKAVLPDCRFTNLTQDLNDGLVIA
jgi:filamin